MDMSIVNHFSNSSNPLANELRIMAHLLRQPGLPQVRGEWIARDGGGILGYCAAGKIYVMANRGRDLGDDVSAALVIRFPHATSAGWISRIVEMNDKNQMSFEAIAAMLEQAAASAEGSLHYYLPRRFIPAFLLKKPNGEVVIEHGKVLEHA